MLVLLGYQKTSFLKRDIADLLIYNIVIATVNAFEAMVDAFRDLPTDDQWVSDQMLATMVKDVEADKLRDFIREIMVRAENKWGLDSPQYKKFGTEALAAMEDDALLVCGWMVWDVATNFLIPLMTEGLNAGMLDDLRDQVQAFQNALLAKNDAVGARDLATHNRALEANKLYARMRFLCNYGKQRYWNNNEAKYNDYLMPEEGGAVPVEELVPEPEPVPV